MRRNKRILNMESFLVIVAFVVLLGFILTLDQKSRERNRRRRISELESEEEKNVSELEELRCDISSLKRKLQSIRLKQYKPTEQELIKLRQKVEHEMSTGSLDKCFFCDEYLSSLALVCRSCGRLKIDNMEKIRKNDQEVRRIMGMNNG